MWNFVIRSGNAELIHLLEEKKIEPVRYLYDKYFLNAVECHSNDIAHYIIDKLPELKDEDFTKEYFACYNFEFFPDDFIDNYESIFEYACIYDYTTIVKIFINEKKIEVSQAISD